MKPQDTITTPPPLAPELEALLGHEREIVEVPEFVRARLLARARGALQNASQTTAPAARRLPIWRSPWYAAAAGVLLITSGAVAFQAGHRLFRTEHSPRLPAQSPHGSDHSPPLVPATVPMDPPIAEPPSAEDSLPAPSEATVLRARGSAEELRLLERARKADAHGEFLKVLAVAAEHERRFSRGRLREEREVLRVRALVALHRQSEARAVAAKFRRHFPHSVLMRKVDDLLHPGQ